MTDTPDAPLPDALPAAGWYPAPHAGGEQRYWDGTQWLEPAPVTEGVAPSAASAAGAAAVAAPRKKRVKRWGWVLIGVGALIVVSIVTSALNGSHKPAAEAVSAAPSAVSAPTAPKPTTPPPAPKPTTPPAPAYTVSQQNAIGKAQQYLQVSPFSRDGLIKQLEFEKFSTDDASFAVDHIQVDWNAQALAKAKSYLKLSSFSHQSLVDQLVFDGFTSDQAESGVTAAGL